MISYHSPIVRNEIFSIFKFIKLSNTWNMFFKILNCFIICTVFYRNIRLIDTFIYTFIVSVPFLSYSKHLSQFFDEYNDKIVSRWYYSLKIFSICFLSFNNDMSHFYLMTPFLPIQWLAGNQITSKWYLVVGLQLFGMISDWWELCSTCLTRFSIILLLSLYIWFVVPLSNL